MSVFDKMSKEEIQTAQKKLNLLCNKHSIEEFDIDAKDGLACWRKLIQTMCGIDINDREQAGRKAYTQEFILDVGARIDMYRDFDRFDNQKFEEEGVLEKIGETLLRKVAFNNVAKELKEETGQEYTDDQIRGVYNDYRKLRKEELKDLENDPCDPDELFINMK